MFSINLQISNLNLLSKYSQTDIIKKKFLSKHLNISIMMYKIFGLH